MALMDNILGMLGSILPNAGQQESNDTQQISPISGVPANIISAAQDAQPQQRMVQPTQQESRSFLDRISSPEFLAAAQAFSGAMDNTSGTGRERFEKGMSAYAQRKADIQQEKRQDSMIKQQREQQLSDTTDQRSWQEKQAFENQLWSIYTPESVQAYKQSGDMGVLVKRPEQLTFVNQVGQDGATYAVAIDPYTGQAVEGVQPRMVSAAPQRMGGGDTQDWTIQGGYKINKRTGEIQKLEGTDGYSGITLNDGQVANNPGMYEMADGTLVKVEVSANGNLTAKLPNKAEREMYKANLTAADEQTTRNLETLQGASSKSDVLSPLTGVTGSIGQPAIGADYVSRFKGGETRQVYSAAQEVNQSMDNMGIAQAKAMGASGINTEAEAKRFGASMPKIDFSSPEAYQNSLNRINIYVQDYNKQNLRTAPTIKPEGNQFKSKGGVSFTVE